MNKKFRSLLSFLLMLVIVITQTLTPLNANAASKKSKENYTITFETNGGSEVSSQTIQKTNKAVEPDKPTKEGFVFDGWYRDSKLENKYSFNAAVTKNLTLYAKWKPIGNGLPDSDNTIINEIKTLDEQGELDLSDENNNNIPDVLEGIIGLDTDHYDTDEDGLPDYFEEFLGTNKLLQDTDEDGLPDAFEFLNSKTNPVLADSDNNGILDCDEDLDHDGLTNALELKYKSDSLNIDTDLDGLNDYKEAIELHTNPSSADTDSDQLCDADELKYSMDPLKEDTLGDGILDGNRVFGVKLTGEESDNKKVEPTLELELKGWQISSLEIDKIEDTDNFLNSSIPGYLGNAYNFNVDGDFPSTKATVSFKIDHSYFENSEFDPAIFYWDEKEQILEEVPNQKLEGDVLSAELEHFSSYIVLAKNIYFPSLLEYEILPPTDEELQNKNFDVMLVLDESGSISSSDFSKMKSLCMGLIDDLGDSDRIGVITFDDSIRLISDLKSKNEISTVVAGLTQHDGLTAIYDAIDRARSVFSSDSINTKIVIALTDGSDNSSRISYSQVAQNALNDNVIVYTIGVGSSVSKNNLISIAEATGGKYYAASNFSELGGVFNRVVTNADLYKDSDEDGLSDYHEKCIMNGTLKTGSGAPLLKFSNLNYLNDDSDGDEMLDGEEISIEAREINGKTAYYCRILANPCLIDSDSDGINDFVEIYAGLEPLVDESKSSVNSTAALSVQGPGLINTFWEWYEMIGDYSWNYIHNAVEADIVAKNSGTKLEYCLKSKTGKTTGRIDVLRDLTGEIWDVKPASYQFSPRKELGIAQLARYIALGAEPQNGPIPLKIGGSYVKSGTISLDRYGVEYTNMLNGLVCYHFTRNIPIVVPVPVPAPSDVKDDVKDVTWYEYLWALAKEVGYNAQKFGEAVYSVIESAFGYVADNINEIIIAGVEIGGVVGILYIIVHLLPLLPAVVFA